VPVYGVWVLAATVQVMGAGRVKAQPSGGADVIARWHQQCVPCAKKLRDTGHVIVCALIVLLRTVWVDWGLVVVR